MTDQEGMRNRSTSKWGDATQPASGMWGRGPIPSPWRWYCEYQHLGYDSLRYICIHFSKGSLSPGMEPLTSQILKYSKITHKFLWEFYHQQRERTLLVWKKKKNTQLQGLEFSQFFSVVIWLIEIKHMLFWKYTIEEPNQSFVFISEFTSIIAHSALLPILSLRIKKQLLDSSSPILCNP